MYKEWKTVALSISDVVSGKQVAGAMRGTSRSHPERISRHCNTKISIHREDQPDIFCITGSGGGATALDAPRDLQIRRVNLNQSKIYGC